LSFRLLLNGNIRNVDIINSNIVQQENRGIDYSPAQLAAAMVASSDRQENGLVDLTVKSRHLLSDYDYPDAEARSGQVEEKSSATRRRSNDVNLTRSGNESSMELVFVNGTWQMIDLNLCYKFLSLNASGNQTFFNLTHVHK
jgi:hypothetical protein